jgi:HEPN domain-containing protein
VVREAQELVELALKGMLRAIGIEPPKLHDVETLSEFSSRRAVSSVQDRKEAAGGRNRSRNKRSTPCAGS